MKKNLTYGPRLPFRQCGFEFTAEKRADFKYPVLKQKQIESVDYSPLSNSYMSCTNISYSVDLNEYCAYDIYFRGKHFEKSPKWMRKNMQDDDCFECPSPIVKNRAEISKYFIEFETWIKKCGLTLDIDKAEQGLGGCHIHISLAGLGKARGFFVTNLINFVTNYPELNWAFNDPNDIHNANNLLTLEEIRSLDAIRGYFNRCQSEGRLLRLVARQERLRVRRERRERAQVIIDSNGTLKSNNKGIEAAKEYLSSGTVINRNNTFLRGTIVNPNDQITLGTYFPNNEGESENECENTDLPSINETMREAILARIHQMPRNTEAPERITTNRYEMAIVSPANTNKCGSINFNYDYDTVEFRFFDQPKNLTQHLLHTEVAQRIFDYCLKKAKRMEAIELKIDTSFFNQIDREKSIERFNKCMKIIKVDPSRCKTQIANINQRFEWHNEDPQFGYLK